MNLEWPLNSFTVPRYIYNLPGQTWITGDNLLSFVMPQKTPVQPLPTCELLTEKLCVIYLWLRRDLCPQRQFPYFEESKLVVSLPCALLYLSVSSMDDLKFFTYFTTTLWWIRGEPRNVCPFVAN